MAQTGDTAGDYTLLPALAPVDPDAALAAATAEIDAAFAQREQVEPSPLGRGWAFDFSTGQFIRHGAAPAQTFGTETLWNWIQAALSVYRYGALVHPDEFGLDDVAFIGAPLDATIVADLEAAIRAALLVHDRIEHVDDFVFSQDDPLDDVVYVSFTVTTDEDDKITAERLPLLTGS